MFLALILIPLAFLAIRSRFRSPLNQPFLNRYPIEATVLSSVIAFILISFLIIQFPYVFATVPETQLHQFGINTYSEYVRRGFFELILVSIIVYAVAGLSLLVYRQSQTNTKLKLANLTLMSIALIFIFSILRRVSLYQIYHGLSRSRFYGAAFLVSLIGLTIILILRHLRLKFNHWYQYEIGLVLATIFFTVILTPDRLIATAFPPTVNQEIDYTYIARLSPDAVDGWLEAYSWAKTTVTNRQHLTQFTPEDTRQLIYAESVLSALSFRYSQLNHQYATAFPPGQVNFAQLSAYQKLRLVITLEDLDQLSNQALNLSQTARSQHQIIPDRSGFSPLVK